MLNTTITADIFAKYTAGWSCATLATQYGVCDETIRKCLIKNGILRRSMCGRHLTTIIDESVFDSITPESAYWIGFLMADGNVYLKRHCISLKLAEKDAEHIYKFQTFLHTNYAVTHYSATCTNNNKAYAAVRLCIYSKRLTEKLATYGVLPNKSFTAKAVNVETNRDFWRGVVDGDGCLRFCKNGNNIKYPHVDLIGSLDLMQQYKVFLERNIPDYTPHVNPLHKIYSVRTGGQNAKTIAALLYKDATTALSRKTQIAKEFYE